MIRERICALLLCCAFGCALFTVIYSTGKVIHTKTKCQRTEETRQVDVPMMVGGVMVFLPAEERRFICPKGEVWR